MKVAGSGVERKGYTLCLSQRKSGKSRHRERLNIVAAMGLRQEIYIPRGGLLARHGVEGAYKEHRIRFAFLKDLLPRQPVEWFEIVKAISMTIKRLMLSSDDGPHSRN